MAAQQPIQYVNPNSMESKPMHHHEPTAASPLLPTAHVTTKQQTIEPHYSHDGRRSVSIGTVCCSSYVSLFLSFFIVSATLAQILCEVLVYNDPHYAGTLVPVLPRVLIYVPLGLSILYYWVMVFTCSTFKYLMNNNNAENTYGFIERLQQTRPIITLRIECYHYELRTEYYRDNKGRQRTRTRMKKVTTYVEARNFDYMFHRDVSQPFILGGSNKKYIKVKLKNIVFMDNQESKAALDKARLDIQVQNRWRDSYMNYHERWEVPGFRENLLAKVSQQPGEQEKRSFFFSMPCYLLMSLVMLNFVYRFIFDKQTDTQEYELVKEISVVPFPVTTITTFTPQMYMNSAYGFYNSGIDSNVLQPAFQQTYNQDQKEYIPPQQVTQPYVKQ